jgi:hypothetical protein
MVSATAGGRPACRQRSFHRARGSNARGLKNARLVPGSISSGAEPR